MTTILISVPTILLSSTAPSVLSRRSVSVCAALPSGKMLPVDLGRFFRPYGAEHMHAHPPPEPSQTQRAMPSLFWWLLCPLWRRRRHADAAGCGLFFPPPCLMPKAPSRSGAWLFPRTGSEKISQQLPPHPSRAESHLQPLLKADREAPPSSAPRSRVRRIQREPTAKQVVTLRLKINRFCAYRTNDMIFLHPRDARFLNSLPTAYQSGACAKWTVWWQQPTSLSLVKVGCMWPMTLSLTSLV